MSGAEQEWAIRDEATGEWWNCDYFGKYAPKDKEPTRFQSYPRAATALVRSEEANLGRASARIVPAPPREMTDAECWEWFRPQMLVLFGQNGKPNEWGVLSWPGREFKAFGKTPCDAIRAARRKLEAKP